MSRAEPDRWPGLGYSHKVKALTIQEALAAFTEDKPWRHTRWGWLAKPDVVAERVKWQPLRYTTDCRRCGRYNETPGPCVNPMCRDGLRQEVPLDGRA